MTIRYRFDPVAKILEADVQTPVSVVDVIRYFDSVKQEPWFPAASLTDLRGAGATMSSDDVRTVAQMLHNLAGDLRGAPIALLVASDVQYGLVRMIEQLQGNDVLICAFRDADEAKQWLKSHSANTELRGI